MKDGSQKYLFIGGVAFGIVVVLTGSVGILFLASGSTGNAPEPEAIVSTTEDEDIRDKSGGSSAYDDTAKDTQMIDVPVDDGAEQPVPNDGASVEIPEATIDEQADELSNIDSSMRLSLRRYVAAWLWSQGVDPTSEAIPTGEAVADQQGASVTLQVPALGQTIACTYDPFTQAWAVFPV